MKINKASTTGYNTVTPECIYDYIRKYTNEIYKEIEPPEDETGNAYKEKLAKFAQCNKTTLKQIAAELETITKRLNYMLYGRY